MVERYPEQPDDERGDTPFFDDSEFERSVARMTQVVYAHSILARATEFDAEIKETKVNLTKSFVSEARGTTAYPFPHLRVKLKEKNRKNTPLKVVALRFPLAEERQIDPRRVYVAWASQTGTEGAFMLSESNFSRIDPERAIFYEEGEDWPSIDALTAATDEERALLASILCDPESSDFEPDLQPHGEDLVA